MGIEVRDDCVFCKIGQNDIGFTDDRDACIIYKTGDSFLEDWYAILQPKTPSNPETGFNLQLMPVGHINEFWKVAECKTLAEKMGYSLAQLSFAMMKILKDGWDNQNGVFVPAQITYGKCLTPENTRDHLHFKLVPFSGDVAQPFPTDASWVKKDVIHTSGQDYVLGNPVKKRRIDSERYEYLKKSLIDILSE